MLSKTYSTFLGIVREVLGSLDGVKSRSQLHNKTYQGLRDRNPVASQLIIEATSHAWSIRKSRPSGDKSVKNCLVRFDSRLFSLRRQDGGTQS